ncbi:lig_chan-Glu_bd domain-containing protein [Nephila pilipes]|uniref:Lig_chan-Glu_bd domain-containing protein n=1 Tax=Nephila pilipes TaxID=299642 RepID=A0A8X6MB94_NEPPI|nr:lig_chan-Glu_bd domain-containing protein [Nephila pilipes]
MKSSYFPKKITLATIELGSIMTIKKVDNKYELGGVEGKLVQCLSEKLDFEIEVLLSPDDEIVSDLGNGTYGGIVGVLQRGEADMGVLGLTISEEVSEAVDFSVPISTLEVTFLTKEPGEMPKVSAFAYPFSLDVWFLYAFMILVATILFQRIMFRNATLLGSFLSVLGSIASQAMENVRETPWRRVLFGLWLATATVMPFFYNTSFLSFLTMPEKVPVPRTFKELSDAVLSGKYKCLTPKEAVHTDLLRASTNEYMVKLGEIIEKNNWLYSYAEQFTDHLDDPVAVLIAKKVFKILVGSPPYVSVKVSDDYLGVWHTAINWRKGFCCRERVDEVLYRLVNSGLYEKWLDDSAFLGKLYKRLEVKHEEPEMQLTLEDLKMAFFALFIGLALSFLAFLAEQLIPRRFDIFYS